MNTEIYQSVIIDGFEMDLILNVDYEIYGKYRPATLLEPDEYPEIEIGNITYQLDGDHGFDLTSELINKISENLNWDDIEEKCWVDASDRDRDYD